jgi:hypothetical protein
MLFLIYYVVAITILILHFAGVLSKGTTPAAPARTNMTVNICVSQDDFHPLAGIGVDLQWIAVRT